ncbi:hypothetical protein C8F01DRAFT_1329290 [Mycena amicta]|nr:hypothetical protein C8F01DRAFT_1329290 [Mycena amicta]
MGQPSFDSGLEHVNASSTSGLDDDLYPDPMQIDSDARSEDVIPHENDSTPATSGSPADMPLPPRIRRRPARFRELLPERLQPIQADPPAQTEPTRRVLPSVRLLVRETFDTVTNTFNLWRSYLHRPTYDPDSLLSEDDFSNQHLSEDLDPKSPPSATASAKPSSYLNRSISILMGWHNNGHTTKTASQLDALVNDVLLDPDFRLADLENFSAQRAEKEADKEAEEAFPWVKDFEAADIKIEVPSGVKDIPARPFTIPGLRYRSLVSVIKAAFADPLSLRFHLSPFKLFHRLPGTKNDMRVYSELYNSDAFIKEHDHVRLHGALPPDDPNCKLEKVVAALMFWSDSTHLANFGTAKLWPIYMLFGNLSKYIRDKPSSGAEHHVAFIPSLPDFIQDTLKEWHPKWRTQKGDILTHCRRELMHAVWSFLLDDAFLHAYKYGIVIKCADGKYRRVYPRIFTYSADYPEKVLLATIRDGGLCPCPRCLIPKTEVHTMGFVRDFKARLSKARKYLLSSVQSARRFIYDLGFGIGSDAVDNLLKESSSVPTINAFIARLGENFDLHRMLVVDFMHEFELGVWKNLFIHLIRLLYALPDGVNKVSELDRRYRATPTFGTDTIRCFATNASEMKKLGARDFEDLLQCAVPAFDGLFPEPHNKRVLTLLFRMAEWHSFAKLRMHTDPTLEHLERLTSEIGRLMREFRLTTCTELTAFELPREVAARSRSAAQKAAKSAAAAGLPIPDATVPPVPASTKKVKMLNPSTYKWHAIGDYPATIPLFGPTDIYSTRYGEALHRQLKRMYSVTNKRDHTAQIAKRVTRLHRARLSQATKDKTIGKKLYSSTRRKARDWDLQFDDPFAARVSDLHHSISSERRKPIDIFELSGPTQRDPALKDFVSKLKDHLLGRILGRDFDGDDHDDFTDNDRRSLLIHDNRIYSTQMFRVNYTTYDVRRDQDVLNARNLPFVMVRSPTPEAHLYWYAQILRVYNATVCRLDASGAMTGWKRMEFLFVRWMGDEPSYRASIKKARPQPGACMHASL